jgi:hypothetical protein
MPARASRRRRWKRDSRMGSWRLTRRRERGEERREEGPRKCADLCGFQGMGFVFIRGDP